MSRRGRSTGACDLIVCDSATRFADVVETRLGMWALLEDKVRADE